MLVHKLGAPSNPELAIGSGVVCLDTPDDFFAEGQFFEDFSQVSDKQAIAILRWGGTEAA